MPALLLSPLARWGALAAVVGALALWGWAESTGRQVAVLEAAEARREAATLRERIKHMETRNAVEDAVRREPSPVDRLRDEWSRP
jgi:hypothetical protein